MLSFCLLIDRFDTTATAFALCRLHQMILRISHEFGCLPFCSRFCCRYVANNDDIERMNESAELKYIVLRSCHCSLTFTVTLNGFFVEKTLAMKLMRQVSSISQDSNEELKDVQVLEKALSRRFSKTAKPKVEKKKAKKVKF